MLIRFVTLCCVIVCASCFVIFPLPNQGNNAKNSRYTSPYTRTPRIHQEVYTNVNIPYKNNADSIRLSLDLLPPKDEPVQSIIAQDGDRKIQTLNNNIIKQARKINIDLPETDLLPPKLEKGRNENKIIRLAKDLLPPTYDATVNHSVNEESKVPIASSTSTIETDNLEKVVIPSVTRPISDQPEESIVTALPMIEIASISTDQPIKSTEIEGITTTDDKKEPTKQNPESQDTSKEIPIKHIGEITIITPDSGLTLQDPTKTVVVNTPPPPPRLRKLKQIVNVIPSTPAETFEFTTTTELPKEGIFTESVVDQTAKSSSIIAENPIVATQILIPETEVTTKIYNKSKSITPSLDVLYPEKDIEQPRQPKYIETIDLLNLDTPPIDLLPPKMNG